MNILRELKTFMRKSKKSFKYKITRKTKPLKSPKKWFVTRHKGPHFHLTNHVSYSHHTSRGRFAFSFLLCGRNGFYYRTGVATGSIVKIIKIDPNKGSNHTTSWVRSIIPVSWRIKGVRGCFSGYDRYVQRQINTITPKNQERRWRHDQRGGCFITSLFTGAVSG